MERATNEVWAKRVQRWKESGLTAKEFGAETGIHPGTLSYWKWRLGAKGRGPTRRPEAKRSVGRKAAGTGSLSFIELAPPVPLSGDTGFAFEVALQAGAVVRM